MMKNLSKSVNLSPKNANSSPKSVNFKGIL